MDLRIDPEFAEKIPPLTDEEFEQLEANILADRAVINPLITWNGVIVDGHNRYRILQRHPDIPFQTYEKEFSDRYEVIAWICKNQLGRRNLTPAQRKYLIGKQYEAEKISESFHGNQYSVSEDDEGSGPGQNDPHHFERTSERIAKEIGKGEKYVRRAEEFAKGIDAAEDISPGIRHEIFSGVIKPTDSDIAAIAHADPEDRPDLVENLRRPRPAARGQPITGPDDTDDTSDDTDEDAEIDEAEETPFVPSKASIRRISEAMESTPDRPRYEMPAEFIIEELDDALDTMIYRWDFCLRENSREATDKECCRQIQDLVKKGIAYFKLYRGGKKRNEEG